MVGNAIRATHAIQCYGKRREGLKFRKEREYEISTKALQHALTVVLLPEFHRGELDQTPNVSAEALGRRVVESIGDVRDRKPRVLEQLRSTDQSRHCQVPLRRRKPRPEKPAHQRARNDAEMLGQRPNGDGPSRMCE